MTHTLGTIREFRTPNFRVIVDALPEDDLDLSWDDNGEIATQLDNGDLIAFVARARVIHRGTGAELGTDYLGACIYRTIYEFQNHRECGQTANCGSYFADMIRAAIAEARINIAKISSAL